MSASFRPEAVARYVASDRGDAAGDHLIERFRRAGSVELFAQPIEGVVLEEFFAGSLGRSSATPIAYEQDKLTVGCAAQQPFNECGADKAGSPRDGDALASERCCDHGPLSTTW